MSIKLSNGEKIVRNYDYAEVKTRTSTTTKTLIVTNRRLIHREVSSGFGNESISNREMPVKAAKYVDVYYGMKSCIGALVIGIIAAILAIVLLFSGLAGESKKSSSNDRNNNSSYNQYYDYNDWENSNDQASKGGIPTGNVVGAVICIAVAVIAILIFVLKKKRTLTCTIDADTPVNNAFSFSGKTEKKTALSGLFGFLKMPGFKFGTKMIVKIHPEVASQIADELGSVIAAAANGDFDESGTGV